MSSVASRMTSRRVLRTLPWVSALVLVAGVVAFLIAYVGNTGKKIQVEPTGNRPAQVDVAQPTVKLDPAARKVAGEFIADALTRRNLQHLWDISHPEFRAGITHAEWLKGTLPAVPYVPPKAIAGVTYKVDESHPRQAYLHVLMLTKPSSGVRSEDFYIGLKAVGTGKSKRWLVNYFIPASGGGIVPATP
jgi:hypothetical protein